jgi:hypothetical protein
MKTVSRTFPEPLEAPDVKVISVHSSNAPFGRRPAQLISIKDSLFVDVLGS